MRLILVIPLFLLSLAGLAGAQGHQHQHGPSDAEPTRSEPAARSTQEEKPGVEEQSTDEDGRPDARCDESCWENRIKRRYAILEKKWQGSTDQIMKGYHAARKNLAEKYKNDPAARRGKIAEMGKGILEFANAAKKYIECESRYGGNIPDRLLRIIRGNLNEAMLEKMGEEHPTIMNVGLGRIMDTVCPDDCSARHGDDTKRKTPRDPISWIWNGKHWLDRHPGRAREDFEQALTLDPKSVEALLGRAYANYKLNNFSAAAEDARTALGLDPHNASALAVLKLAAGRGDGAAPGAGQSAGAVMPGAGAAQAAAPGAVDISNINLSVKYAQDARRAMSLGDYESAAERAGRALDSNARNAAAYNLRSIAYSRQRLFDQALRDALAGLKLDASNSALLNSQAYALNRLKRYREAMTAAQRALEVNPKDGAAYRMRAFALGGMGDRLGLLDSLSRAAELDAGNKKLLDAALQHPQDGDLAFLFSQDLENSDAPNAAPAAARSRRFAIVAVSSIGGGFLLALGVFQFLVSQKTGKLSAPRAWNPLSQYKTLRQIGVGGMGVVYEGTDLSLGRRVAIKKMRDEIKSDRRERERFVNEARLVAALHHPHIVDIYSIVEDEDDIYLIFEYIQGKTLDQMLAGKPMNFSQAMPILRCVAAALDFAHEQRVIHRDLKPSNIMVTDQGLVKVMDFGIARLAKETALRYSVTNTVVGTPPYMAPEQQKGLVRKESDIYALAVCLYEMLSGATPFRGDPAGMLLNKSNKYYASISSFVAGLPAGLDKIFDQAFDPDPDKRFLSAKEFLLHLDGLAES